MSIKKKEAERIFKKLNIKSKSSNHHVAGWLICDKQKIGLVHFSHGRGDMPGMISTRFAKSLFLSVSEAKEMGRCHISADEYFDILKDRL